MRKIVSLLMIFCLVFTMTSSVFAKDNSNGLTAEKYEAWLESKIENASIIEKKDLNNALKKFKALSAKDKKKFINLLSNPEVIHDTIKVMNKNISSGETKKLYNDDVIVKSETKQTKAKIRYFSSSSDVETNTAEDTITAKIVGIPILEVYGTVTYDYEYGVKITEVQAGNIQVVKNLNPALTTETSLTSLHKSRTVANAEADITFGFGIDAYDVDFGGLKFTVSGDWKGNDLGMRSKEIGTPTGL